MEFPKDVVCIETFYLDKIIEGNTYIALSVEHGVYTGTIVPATGYTIKGYNGCFATYAFRDLDDINIKEVMEILREELCPI